MTLVRNTALAAALIAIATPGFAATSPTVDLIHDAIFSTGPVMTTALDAKTEIEVAPAQMDLARYSPGGRPSGGCRACGGGRRDG